jgi:hypothetical protein
MRVSNPPEMLSIQVSDACGLSVEVSVPDLAASPRRSSQTLQPTVSSPLSEAARKVAN